MSKKTKHFVIKTLPDIKFEELKYCRNAKLFSLSKNYQVTCECVLNLEVSGSQYFKLYLKQKELSRLVSRGQFLNIWIPKSVNQS